jgi:hypothetical protein
VVKTLWKNGNTDGTGGLLDEPVEVLLHGGTLVISNFDKPMNGFVNTKFDKPYTLSVIALSKVPK